MTNRHAPQRIVLVGMPGSGKSVVARMIAKRLGNPWQGHDTDDAIVAIDGRAIPTIFEESGEPAFRRVEQQAIAQYDGAGQVVLATGGGAVLDSVNRGRLW